MATKKRSKKPAAKQRSKANAKPQNKKDQNLDQSKNQVRAIIFTALSIFFFVLVLIPEKDLGGLAKFLNDLMFGLFGMFAYIVPVVTAFFSVKMAFKTKRNNKATILFTVAFCVFLATGFMVFKQALSSEPNYFKYIGASYLDGVNNFFSGGVLGGILGWPFTALLGSPLDKITIVILLIVTLMFATGTTLLRLGVFAKQQKERLEAIHNETREKKENKEKEEVPSEPIDFTKEQEEKEQQAQIEEKCLNILLCLMTYTKKKKNSKKSS